MRIEVNKDKLKDFPYLSKEGCAIGHDNSSLKDKILYGNPATILVSGYRGVGKTSAILALDKDIKKHNRDNFKLKKDDNSQGQEANNDTEIVNHADKPVLFVNIKCGKHDSYENFLRRLIRASYDELKLLEKDLADYWKSQNNKNNNLINELGELQKLQVKTFNDTKDIYDLVQREEEALIREEFFGLSFNLTGKGLFQIVIYILAIIGFSISEDDTKRILIFSIAYLLISSFSGGISLKRTSDKKNSTNLQWKNWKEELYDTEIAEVKLNDRYKTLKEYFKIVIVVDELDKMEDSEVEKLLAEFKHLMNSGNFFTLLVAGQGLYHQYLSEKSDKDDSILANLISDVEHVALPSRETITKYIREEIFVQESIKAINEDDSQLLTEYIERKLLESTRVPRRIINEIRKDVKYEKTETIIDLEWGDMPNINYKALNNIIDRIAASKQSQSFYDSHDYYLSVTNALINKLLSFGNTEFTLDEIAIKGSFSNYVESIEQIRLPLLDVIQGESVFSQTTNDNNGIRFYSINKLIVSRQPEDLTTNFDDGDADENIIDDTNLVRAKKRYSEYMEDFLRIIDKASNG